MYEYIYICVCICINDFNFSPTKPMLNIWDCYGQLLILLCQISENQPLFFSEKITVFLTQGRAPQR